MKGSIMIQGTMSNAGKSVLAGGLCRVLKQDGYSVAPFKSQNMALNSFITKEGLEMGRAQVMQAEAAGIEPAAAMNPILLKPTNDTGSQVIINGKPVGTMSAVEYYKHKKDYIPYIMEAYEGLKRKHDVIVIEGAGSPAEINLKQDDIVNMGLAELVDAPVIQEFPICLECEFIEYQDGKYGCGVIGKVVNVTADEKVMTDGRIDMSKVNAIAFDPYTHGYYRVTERVGEAFQDGLKLKK